MNHNRRLRIEDHVTNWPGPGGRMTPPPGWLGPDGTPAGRDVDARPYLDRPERRCNLTARHGPHMWFDQPSQHPYWQCPGGDAAGFAPPVKPGQLADAAATDAAHHLAELGDAITRLTGERDQHASDLAGAWRALGEARETARRVIAAHDVDRETVARYRAALDRIARSATGTGDFRLQAIDDIASEALSGTTPETDTTAPDAPVTPPPVPTEGSTETGPAERRTAIRPGVVTHGADTCPETVEPHRPGDRCNRTAGHKPPHRSNTGRYWAFPSDPPPPAARARSCPTCHSIGGLPTPYTAEGTCRDPWHDQADTADPVRCYCGRPATRRCPEAGSIACERPICDRHVICNRHRS